jgi:hypothetical protein
MRGGLVSPVGRAAVEDVAAGPSCIADSELETPRERSYVVIQALYAGVTDSMAVRRTVGCDASLWASGCDIKGSGGAACD